MISLSPGLLNLIIGESPIFSLEAELPSKDKSAKIREIRFAGSPSFKYNSSSISSLWEDDRARKFLDKSKSN